MHILHSIYLGIHRSKYLCPIILDVRIHKLVVHIHINICQYSIFDLKDNFVLGSSISKDI